MSLERADELLLDAMTVAELKTIISRAWERIFEKRDNYAPAKAGGTQQIAQNAAFQHPPTRCKKGSEPAR